MVRRIRSYVQQHHLAMIALFVALGGTGAYAAGKATTGGEVRAFSAHPTNASGAPTGSLRTLAGIELRWRSQAQPDSRVCRLSVKSSARGQVDGFFANERSEGPSKNYFTRRKVFAGPGSFDVADALFDAGSPGITGRSEGQLTWHNGATNQVVTAVFHVFAGAGSCEFQGTLSRGG